MSCFTVMRSCRTRSCSQIREVCRWTTWGHNLCMCLETKQIGSAYNDTQAKTMQQLTNIRTSCWAFCCNAVILGLGLLSLFPTLVEFWCFCECYGFKCFSCCIIPLSPWEHPKGTLHVSWLADTVHGLLHQLCLVLVHEGPCSAGIWTKS